MEWGASGTGHNMVSSFHYGEAGMGLSTYIQVPIVHWVRAELVACYGGMASAVRAAR